MNTPRRNALGSVVACILCGASGLAAADQPNEIVVTYSDLDLNTPYGARTMYARLEAAARTACTARAGSWSAHGISSCVDYNVRQAVAQIDAPQLDTLYQTRTGHAVLRARHQSQRQRLIVAYGTGTAPGPSCRECPD